MASRVVVLFLCVLLAGCDKDSPAPPDTAPPSSGERITGNERLGWDQRASTAAELAALRYNIYVDSNAGVEIQDARCADAPGASGFACSGRLPQMAPGQHTLALTSFVDAGGTRLESPRSSSLVVIVGQGADSGAPPAPPASTSVTTLDGVRLRALAVASGLDDPMDLAIAPDGRTFIAERSGSIRVVRGGVLQPSPAIVLDDVLASGRRGLLALAVDPDYGRTAFVFAVYTTPRGFRLVRLRGAGDSLGDVIVLLDGIDAPLPAPAAALRFGPDGKLYLAVDNAGIPETSGDRGSYNGKVLRLNPDGTTPADQAGATPVFATDLSSPRGLDWMPSPANGRTMWIVEDAAGGAERLLGVASTPAPTRGETVLNYTLPPRTGPAGMAIYRGDLIPRFAGNMLIGSADGAAILRLRFDPADGRTIVASERILAGALGRIGAIAIGSDGAPCFFADGTLFRLIPEPAEPAPR